MKEELYIIHCSTGCTCCSYENHTRGFFKSKEDANKRIEYYNSKDSSFWPLGSQYAARGRYSVEAVTARIIDEETIIIEEYDSVVHSLYIVKLNEDGSIEDNNGEILFIN